MPWERLKMAQKLTAQQNKAIEGLLMGMKVPAAAQHAGTSERTLYRWRSSPAFYAELDRRTTEMLDDTTRHMAAVMRGVPEVLEGLIHSKDVPPAVAVSASNVVLAHTPKLIEINLIKRRLDELEEAYATQNKRFAR